MWNIGDKHNYLGMTFIFNRDKKNVSISMTKYVEDLLVKYEVTGTSKAPAGVNLFENDNLSKELGLTEKDKFHSAVASILFLAKRVRADLLLATSFLCTRVSNPTEEDNRKLIKLFKYINYTKHFYTTINGNDISKPWIAIDASYGIHNDRKSHSGVVGGIGGGAIICKSAKQK